MSFPGRSIDELVRIAEAGAGFRLDGAARPMHDLVRIAGAASPWGVRLVFAGMDDRSTGDLVRIATAGEGTAEFEG